MRAYCSIYNALVFTSLCPLPILYKQVTDGERVTLTLWFSRDASHDEESKLISFLSQISLDDFDSKCDSFLPIPSPINMYWFPPDEASKFSSGFDIRCGRLYVLGFELYSSREISCGLPSDSSSNLLELLKEPLQLAQVDELSANKFANVTHALQVSFTAPPQKVGIAKYFLAILC